MSTPPPPDRVYVIVAPCGRMLALTGSADDRLLTRSPSLAKHFRSLADALDHLRLLEEHATRRGGVRWAVESVPASLLPGGRLAGLTIE
jgi:hypothetical protein